MPPWMFKGNKVVCINDKGDWPKPGAPIKYKEIYTIDHVEYDPGGIHSSANITNALPSNYSLFLVEAENLFGSPPFDVGFNSNRFRPLERVAKKVKKEASEPARWKSASSNGRSFQKAFVLLKPIQSAVMR